jgi:hypothetical protein
LRETAIVAANVVVMSVAVTQRRSAVIGSRCVEMGGLVIDAVGIESSIHVFRIGVFGIERSLSRIDAASVEGRAAVIGAVCRDLQRDLLPGNGATDN